ncbi:MAG: AAA family ATPase [Treponema sp.]|nr:AAA family ATPase [Candidatus Treponema equifaecale]
MEKRRYPIGLQDFAKIREGNYIYVDKTQYVYDLASVPHPFFLSRPRRFGKSLFISTLKYYFSGRKDLFEGLAISELEKDWIEYPVFDITFANGYLSTNESLKDYMDAMLKRLEATYDVTDIFPKFSDRLQNLILKAHEVTGHKVVILIDEYDKPILDAIFIEDEEKNRSMLRDFYSPLKGMDQYIQFIFITGITKISQLNIFSGLNQLDDISMNRNYSSICGISETELEKYFQTDIETLAAQRKLTFEKAKEKLAKMYDGYHFSLDSDGVYNPFCLIKCFNENFFGSYWFETGVPSFLVKTLQHQPLFLSRLVGGCKVKENDFKNYSPETKNMLPVIYQSGFLTIKDYDDDSDLYTLDFPNKEIEDGFLEVLVRKFVQFPEDNLGLAVSNMVYCLRAHDIDSVMKMVKTAIADLPTILKKDACENYYESVTHLMFRVTGLDVTSELQTFLGRSDIIVRTEDAVFIFELKMDKGRPLEEVMEEALFQIDDKGYSDRYAVSGKKMFKIGVVFSSSGKGLLEWRIK